MAVHDRSTLGEANADALTFRRICVLAVLIVASSLCACTEEKAKALKLAAESFKAEADAACVLGAESLLASVAMPPATRSEIAAKLATASRFNASQLDEIYAANSISEEGIAPAIDALKKACAAQKQLAAIYQDLPNGVLLATDDVAKAHKHVVNVTLRFAKFAKIFSWLPNVGQDNAARVKIIEAQKRALAVADEKARTPLLDALAGDILENQDKEMQARKNVLAQLAKATLRGEQLTKFSQNFDQVSLADILDALRDFSRLYGDVSGKASVAQGTIDKINEVDTRIRNDPRLSRLIDADLTQ